MLAPVFVKCIVVSTGLAVESSIVPLSSSHPPETSHLSRDVCPPPLPLPTGEPHGDRGRSCCQGNLGQARSDRDRAGTRPNTRFGAAYLSETQPPLANHARTTQAKHEIPKAAVSAGDKRCRER